MSLIISTILDWNIATAPYGHGVLSAELDAYYAVLYSLTEEELHYIINPKDVYRHVP